MNFVKRKKNFFFSFSNHEKRFWVGAIFNGSADKGKQKYFIFGPTMFAIPFHKYSISQNFGGVSCYQIILYTFYHVHGL